LETNVVSTGKTSTLPCQVGGATKPSMSSGSELESTSFSGWLSMRRSQVLPLRAVVQIQAIRDSSSESSKGRPAVGE
jgi:hypothetical protein